MPNNLAIHQMLLSQGFTHTHHEAEIDDYGDGESGPMVRYCPAWDEYESPTHRVIIDQDGEKVVDEPRDLALEAWIEEMAGGPHEDERDWPAPY